MIEKYLQTHYTCETAKAYQREIMIYLSNCEQAETALYKDVTAYIGLLRKRYKKAATLNRIVASIKVYYDYLCDVGIRSDNPAKAIRLKDKRSRDVQLQDLFSSDELEQLFYRKERYTHLDYRNKVLISLFIYQGVLPQEVEAVSITDINLHEGTIYIRSTAKTNNRTLPLKPNQILPFHTYLHDIRPKLLQGNQTGSLLVSLRGEAMSAEDLTKHIKRGFTGIYGRRRVNAQTIRQSVITNLLKAGNDISVVQLFAGHKYPSATERYKQTEVETLQAAVNKYHPFSGS